MSRLRWILPAIALLILPFYVDEFWLRTGFAICGAAIGALGLNLLLGTTGQLSLAHSFFLAVGAIGYTYFADSLGWPPALAMLIAVGLAGLAGLAFSPLAARLRGIYLGVASLALVFGGQHVLNSWTSVTGGFNGRSVPDFSLFGFPFADTPRVVLLGVPFAESERLWYLGLALLLGAFLFARNLVRSRPGTALQAVRDSEIAASVMGVNVQRYKAGVFLVSSAFAGLSGVLYALSIGSVAPESFGLFVSIQYLAMVILGGLGSLGGAVLGAAFVTALPLVLQRYADELPLVTGAGGDGLAAGEAARYLYGLAIVLVVLFQPAGLAGLARRFRFRTAHVRRGTPDENTSVDPGSGDRGRALDDRDRVQQ
ncbi:branched-chain amino acid ABC transporter permease [Cryptosporangium aurantiacum]|uniref:Amino acid/amide ABC transporter membrane protein 2, HAAT family n=1 Tax=Cryptosporangium aurantiacum TaxID=134849 RepID=A0A1M7PAL6_9ACTN|nr:branched-chain amino acid ABC transporter permease [Cryptosporangium aurantiacum]SHN13892.1 amino acid/amide ABC transporter membrane protein 2, HAAT family [Cryptosporangium aurantiacum]